MTENLQKVPVKEILQSLESLPANGSISFADSLRQTIRWSSFRANESYTVWQENLGAPGNVFSHSIAFYGLGKSFLKHEQRRYSPEEQRKLLLGFMGHDFGEGELDGNQLVGDIASIEKTKEDEELEHEFALGVVSRLELDQELQKELKEAYQDVVVGDDEELHHAFRALEITDYVMTALKLFQRSKEREEKELPVIENRDVLVAQVIVNNLTTVLEDYAPEYPDSIGEYFREMAPVVEQALEETRGSIEGVEKYKNKIAKFEEAWEGFKSS